MDKEIKINKTTSDEEVVINKKPKYRKRKKALKIGWTLSIFLGIVFIAFSSQVLVSKQSSTSWFAKLPIIKQIKQLAESADRNLKGEDMDRINILLLGMGGLGHDGGYLTDTIMITSIEPSTGKVAMISIPRDLAVPIENYGWQKINHINAYAEMEEADSGGLAVSQAISDLLDIPIDYYVRADFSGFINIVDKLGGIDVMVENTLDDYSYPIMGEEENPDWDARFKHLHVEAGEQHMNGMEALEFARSRHGINGEGSDFARAKRQQLIIQAVKEKVFNASNLLKPSMITGIISELNEHISTNLKIWEILKLKDMLENVSKDDITTKVIDNSANGLLADTISDQGAYLLVPKSGDFSEVQYFVHNVFTEAPEEIKTEVNQEHATVEVRNGTWINGLASEIALDLERYGFTVVRIGNSSRQNFQKSVIYDLSYGEKDKSLEILKEKTGANISFGLPDWLLDDLKNELDNEINPVQPDFLLIIGQDADSTESGTENKEDYDLDEEE